ncbi:unnamed protein product [Periconia digitata]|uniref:Rhodopsin domain-containing protein n=1 Tax=Periconia digitata TaxID=1303443 RepID=A0A9W4XSU8_9PLEO|nr:unnamed protein product [Periconia digitata]
MAPPTNELGSLGDLTFIVAVALLALSWITVSLRVWVRFGITKSPGWDDAAMVFTLCLFTCYVTFILIVIISLRATQAVTIEQVKQSLIWVQLSEIFYILTTTFLKTSLGLFFLRLLTKPWQRYLFNTILIVSAVYGMFYFLTTVFVCGNPSRMADSFVGSDTCAPTAFTLATGYIYGIINVLADWTFTLVPILILIESDMDRRSKLSISIVIGFAAIGSISSIMRMVYLESLVFREGLTANSIKATIWATAEPGTGIVASSVAILRPLFRKIASDVRSKMSNDKTQAGDETPVTDHEESVVGLKSIDTMSSSKSMDTANNSKLNTTTSSITDDTWEERTSYEMAHVGVGRPMTITVAAGDILSPRKFS